MTSADLNTRLDQLERNNRRLQFIVAVLAVVIILLTIATFSQPSTVEAQGRIVGARSFQLTDDSGRVRGEFSLDADGEPNLTMWREQADDSRVSLGVSSPRTGGETFLFMGGIPQGAVSIHTSLREGTRPALTIYGQGAPGGTAPSVWSAP